MSLDCYPFGERRCIDLGEQPMAIDAAYESNLLVTVIDNCRSVVVFDLNQADQSKLLVSQFKLGESIVIEQVVHCKRGNYIACVGHKDGQPTLYAIFDWQVPAGEQVHIEELNLAELTEPFDETDRSSKLNGIAVCQETGNLVASYGDLVVIYRFLDDARESGDDDLAQKHEEEAWHESSSPQDLASELAAAEHRDRPKCHFRHMVSVKLSVYASRVSLVENYLSIMSLDHVQVLKLELLTLQIQSDGQDGFMGQLQLQQQQVSRSAGSSGESQATAAMMIAARMARGGGGGRAGGPGGANRSSLVGGGGQKEGGQGSGADGTGGETSADESNSSASSMVSGFTSNQSVVTNFSSFLGTDAELATIASRTTGTTGNTANHHDQDDDSQRPMSSQIDSDMSIITMQNLNGGQGGGGSDAAAAAAAAAAADQAGGKFPTLADSSQDDCITWNLNTKKLVKLPTLMHNTSTDLSSFHICHPLELLGPASESIACRVSARIYAPDLSQNQLEPVVLLCKQFDFDRDPIKLVQLEPVYLSQLEDHKRLGVASRGSSTSVPDSAAGASLVGHRSPSSGGTPPSTGSGGAPPVQLLKSRNYDLLASVSCFVATLTNCYIYALNGKKVSRLQTITYPGLCLDLRADLLNVYLLTPLGLQICSTSICDATFRYDWSSSADLNLSFLARDRVRTLTTSHFLVMVASSATDGGVSGEPAGLPEFDRAPNSGGSFLEVLRKPNLEELFERIGHTIQRCQSISIRSNLLTYLHASAQLRLMEIEKQQQQQQQDESPDEAQRVEELRAEVVAKVKEIAVLLAKQLLQKKQTNVITNGRIDRAVKHLLDISFCDLAELLRRHLASLPTTNDQQTGGCAAPAARGRPSFVHDASVEEEEEQQQDSFEATLETDDEELAEDGDFELLKIHLRHTKFNQAILECLKSTIGGEFSHSQWGAFERLTSYMFDHNPRLLIKCAQRVTRDLPPGVHLDGRRRAHLVDMLRQLAEFDSTGINRATVLFTLAILYHEASLVSSSSSGRLDGAPQEANREEEEQEGDQNHLNCLKAMGQIKPSQHLAITMCSNHEIINESMARLVEREHPQVFRLFLNQLQKRGELEAAREFRRLVEARPAGGDEPTGERAVDHGGQPVEGGAESPGEDEEEEQSEDEEEIYDQKLRLLALKSPLELAELFCELSGLSNEASEAEGPVEELVAPAASNDELDRQAMRAFLKASVNLMESQYILARLRENSR